MAMANQAKQLIRDIVGVAGGELAGKVRLHKAFYMAHLFFWKEQEGLLTDYPIVRLPNGPGIDHGDDLIEELEQEGVLELGTRKVGPYSETVFRLVASIEIEPNNPRYDAIRKAVDWVKRKTATKLSEETHVWSRSWRNGVDGEELDIYLDLLTDERYEQIRRACSETDELMRDVFGS